MSTRGAWGLIRSGEEKVTYNHSDSYPEGLGEIVIKFAKNYALILNEIYDQIQLVDENKDKPSEEQWTYCKDIGSVRTDVGMEDDLDWYKALRGSQSEGLNLYGKGLKYMINGKNFLWDSLFCEFAYIINLDTNVLEVYRGFNHDSKAAGRYSYSHNHHANTKNDDYFGVALIGKIPLQVIDSCKVVNEEQEDGEWVEKITYTGGEIVF